MATTSFSKILRKWRGKRLQKEGAEALGVNIKTFQAWEYGVNKPHKLTMAEVVRRMDQNPA